MMKKLILSESELIFLIQKLITEQLKSQPQAVDNTELKKNELITDPNFMKFQMTIPKCVPKLFEYPTALLLDKGYNSLFLKVALGVIGRESDFGSSDRFKYLNPLKTLWGVVGGSTSIGLGQIKPETAKSVGIDTFDLNTALGSLKAVTMILIKNYEKTKSLGYTNNPSNVPNGTGNAKLDMAIATYNLGEGKIQKFCETNNPKLKKPCSEAGKIVDGLTVSNKFVLNYVPNYKSERWDGVNITTHGYVQEVADKIKKFNCF